MDCLGNFYKQKNKNFYNIFVDIIKKIVVEIYRTNIINLCKNVLIRHDDKLRERINLD